MFTMGDLDDLARIFEKQNVMKFLARQELPVSKGETETVLASIIRHWENYDFGRCAVVSKESGKLIGCSGLRSYEVTAELVYLIDELCWDKGLATEIARQCLNFGFKRHGFKNIIAFARHGNAASRKVMKKIGMRYIQELTVFGVFVVKYEISRRDYHLNRQNQRRVLQDVSFV